MTLEKQHQVHDILYQYCHEFLQAQEITHAAFKIIENPTEETILEMTTYLDSFDTVRYGSGAGQSYLMPTCVNQGLTANNVRYAMSEIRKIVLVEDEIAEGEVQIPQYGGGGSSQPSVTPVVPVVPVE